MKKNVYHIDRLLSNKLKSPKVELTVKALGIRHFREANQDLNKMSKTKMN